MWGESSAAQTSSEAPPLPLLLELCPHWCLTNGEHCKPDTLDPAGRVLVTALQGINVSDL